MELHEAVLAGRVIGVRKLLAAKTSYNSTDSSGRTPLHWAIVLGAEDIIQAILVNTPPRFLSAGDRHGRTVLHYASATGKSNIVKILLDRGANVNCKDKYNLTPLHLAAEYGCRDVVECLLNRGADNRAKDERGRVPFDLVSELCFPEVFNFLKSKKLETDSAKCETSETVKSEPEGCRKASLDHLFNAWKQEAQKAKKANHLDVEETDRKKRTRILLQAIKDWRKAEEQSCRSKKNVKMFDSNILSGGYRDDPPFAWRDQIFGPLEGDNCKQQGVQSTGFEPKTLMSEDSLMHSSYNSLYSLAPVEAWEHISHLSSSPSTKPSGQDREGSNFRRNTSFSTQTYFTEYQTTRVSGVNRYSYEGSPFGPLHPFELPSIASTYFVDVDFESCTEWENGLKNEEVEMRRLTHMSKALERRMLTWMQTRGRPERSYGGHNLRRS